MARKDYVEDEPPAVRAEYGVDASALCVRLFNFKTGEHSLHVEHQSFLSEQLKAGRFSQDDFAAHIVGHASKRGAGHYDNQALSERRAKAVRDYLNYRADLTRGKIMQYGRGNTKTRGQGDDDPIDRAVVLVVQSGNLPPPLLIPPGMQPLPGSDQPDGPLEFPEGGFRVTDWEISNIAGIQGTIATSVPQFNFGFITQTVTIKNRKTKAEADLNFNGALFSMEAKLKWQWLEAIENYIKGRNLGLSPSVLPNTGTPIVATPLIRPNPVPADSFTGFGVLAGPSMGLGLDAKLVLFTWGPLLPGPVSMVTGGLGIKAFAGAGGLTLGNPGLSWEFATCHVRLGAERTG